MPTDTYVFGKVPANKAQEAFSFHESQVLDSKHVWPRKREQIEHLAREGCLFAVRVKGSGRIVGLCYSSLDEEEGTWEIGGLTVDPSHQKGGLGKAVARLAVAHTIVTVDPWNEGQTIISHVHKENDDRPRRVLASLGFTFDKEIEVPAELGPPASMLNEEGKLVGDQYILAPTSLPSLVAWFQNFHGQLDDGTPIEFELGGLTLNAVRSDLHDIAVREGVLPPT